MKNKAPIRNASYPILVISLCACFLFYKYVLQVYPNIITEQLMREFNLTGAGLGNLAATFYYTYMITQLFVGVLLDKYSARWLASAAILSCAFGVFLFSHAQSLLTAQLSRALMGVGVSFATVAYMKLAAAWFPPRQFAFVGGLLGTAAMAGAVFGLAPLSMAVDLMGWRNCLAVVGIVGFVLTGMFIIFVRDMPAYMKTITQVEVSSKDILAVFKKKDNWILTFYSGLAFSPIAIFGGLWGNPFLEQAYLLSKTEAASMISLVFIGFGLGSPLLGILSDRISERRNLMFISTLISCVAICLVLYCHPMSTACLSVLLFIFGFGLGSFMLVFAIGKEINSLALTATVVSMINASDAFLDALTEPAIGKLLDFTWDGSMMNGVHYFSLKAYHIALSILPLYLLIAAVLLLMLKSRRI